MKKNKIGIYGLEGSYTHQMAVKILKDKNISLKNIDFAYLPETKDLFNFLNKNEIIIFPIENSIGGTVVQILDCFLKNEFNIFYESFLKINHMLLAKPGIGFEKIKKIYAHPQSFLQCSNFLSKKSWEKNSLADNALAAKFLNDNNLKDSASIGNELTAEIYNLKIIKKNIQNFNENTTRFFWASKKIKSSFIDKIVENKKRKTALIFETKDIPGVLYKSLGAFATEGINLIKIESRPLPGNKNFQYFFFLEFQADLNEERVKRALNELSFFSHKIKIFGSY